MSVEGPLFVVRRSVEAHFRIVILNRHTDSVFTEDLGTSEEFQYEISAQNTVLYQNAGSEDRGIWFYDVSELRAFVSTIQPLIQSSNVRTTRTAAVATAKSVESIQSTAAPPPGDAHTSLIANTLRQAQNTSHDPFELDSLLSPFDLNPIKAAPDPLPATAAISLEQFKGRLMQLIQEPSFVSKLYADYVKRAEAVTPNNT
jgi:hypothetical protein